MMIYTTTKEDIMMLRQYLWDNKLTIRQLADALGYSPAHIAGTMRGIYPPSKKLGLAVSIYTKGQVTREDLVYKKFADYDSSHRSHELEESSATASQ